MLDHVLAPDVYDERDARTQRCDVGEILVRPDAEVDAALLHDLQEVGDDRLIPDFVRQQVVGLKEAVLLREFLAEVPEFLVSQLRRQRAICELVL